MSALTYDNEYSLNYKSNSTYMIIIIINDSSAEVLPLSVLEMYSHNVGNSHKCW